MKLDDYVKNINNFFFQRHNWRQRLKCHAKRLELKKIINKLKYFKILIHLFTCASECHLFWFLIKFCIKFRERVIFEIKNKCNIWVYATKWFVHTGQIEWKIHSSFKLKKNKKFGRNVWKKISEKSVVNLFHMKNVSIKSIFFSL